MKELQTLKFTFLLVILFIGQLSLSQTMKQDTLKKIQIEGVFNAKKTIAGNFQRAQVYKIEGYCISVADISQSLADSLNGKKVMIMGKQKIIKGKRFPALEGIEGSIYEPYKEPDKKFIIEPVFKILQ